MGSLSIEQCRQSILEPYMTNLCEQIASCSKCHLASVSPVRSQFYGSIDPELVVIGGPPHASCIGSDGTNPPLGNDGYAFLKAAWSDMEVNDSHILYANAVNCIPMSKQGDNITLRSVIPVEIRSCLGYLEDMLRMVRPKAVLLLGATALNMFSENVYQRQENKDGGRLLPGALSLHEVRGQWFKLFGFHVMATYDPQYLVDYHSHYDEELWEKMNQDMNNDLVAVVSHIQRIAPDSPMFIPF